jgi:hypothetical protein
MPLSTVADANAAVSVNLGGSSSRMKLENPKKKE